RQSRIKVENNNTERYIGKWIGVELDGTLAEYKGGIPVEIGKPNNYMLSIVKEWIKLGREVRIFTARACDPAQIPAVKAWLRRHGLGDLVVTNIKDFDMVELWDDKAIRVKRNKGHVCGGCLRQRQKV
ncbi:hypothetical protein, partial [Methylomagnum sp.]